MNIEHLKNYCYLVSRSKDIKYKLQKFFVLNVPVVIFRDNNGILRGFIDYCPHRGVPLSQGKLTNNCVKCCYHGWEFNFEGVCENIPALENAPRFCLKKIFVEECNGYVFVSLNSNPYSLYNIPDLDSHNHYYWKRTVNGDLIDVLENFLDATHTPFIHQYLIRSPKKAQKIYVQVKCFDRGVTIHYTGENKQSGIISKLFEKERFQSDSLFQMPSIAEINYYSKNGLSLKIRAYLTPTTTNLHDIHALFYFPKSTIVPGFLKYMFAWPFFQLAFLQDKKIVENQFKNKAYVKEYSPIYCEADLVRKHLVNLIVNSSFTSQASYSRVITV
ncbi:Rieske 2Fe-2S domain-containing protein [Wolbachia endosymbiont of Pentalonia nigronervosa]|uniref:Rieske 2Fe-2S domain-containing protein n=1 Tax=Wolbachia endosymbiont of Pentalonia nigronervosa TaxID=1301914 RepID=UPI0016600566|nr:Rieske 2Fe-2S domain-containing protein [Wolbachia endosymbiont of Pentalonia nigronervosa]MBD0391891.1 Rieske 2Fe-2S domain-containing protein [Wolbachia endosymbiont of Pentalonia nigronervosa]